LEEEGQERKGRRPKFDLTYIQFCLKINLYLNIQRMEPVTKSFGDLKKHDPESKGC
jgi:hypothetical protein